MRKREELEIMRHNVTPAQFCAYVRSQVRKKNITCISPEDIDLKYWAAGNDMNFNTDHDGIKEKSVSKPYEMQTYVYCNETGEVFNQIMEMSFDTEKTGTGYFYLVNEYEVPEEQEQEEQAETPEQDQDQKGKETMLKTNSKQAKKNIQEYILMDLDYLEERNEKPFETEQNALAFVYECFLEEYVTGNTLRYYGSYYNAFRSWAAGLALGGLFCYYYNRSAVKDLAEILEETEEQAARFTEEQAEEMLTKLIYRETVKAYEKEQAAR